VFSCPRSGHQQYQQYYDGDVLQAVLHTEPRDGMRLKRPRGTWGHSETHIEVGILITKNNAEASKKHRKCDQFFICAQGL
jgi:hypothetical protein